MKHRFRTITLALVLGWLAAPAAPASAQISIVSQTFATTGFQLEYKVAFDSVNQVYLVVASSSPVYGRFVSVDGVPLGSSFVISAEAAGVGWPNVTFGAPSGDAVFLVTYLYGDSFANPKRGRFVRYKGPNLSPDLGNVFTIVNVFGEWPDSDWSRNTFDGQQFIVSTRIASGLYPDTQLHHVDLAGNVTGGTFIGNPSLDASANSVLDCNGLGTCMAFGTGWGINVGGTGASWGRIFDSTTLQPVGPYFQTDSGKGLMDAQQVTYNANVGKFHTIQVRQRAFADFLPVNTNGTYAAIDYTKSLYDSAGGVGMTALAYNGSTKTSLFATKFGGAAELWVLELGDDGYPRNPNNWVKITGWDGKVPDYYDQLAADGANGRWLSVASLNAGALVTLIQGAATLQTLAITGVSPTSAVPGTSIAIAGSAFQNGATVTFGSSSPQLATFVSSTQVRAVAPAIPAGTVAVTVTNPNGGTASLPNAFTVVNATPTIGSLVPGSATAGDPALTLVVSGSNFVAGAKIYVNGVDYGPTTMVDCTHLSIVLPPVVFAIPAMLSVTVRNPDPSSGSSPAAVFVVTGTGLTFTDDPLVARSTAVKAVHIRELRTAINAVRSRYALAPYPWTDATLAPGATQVKAVHVAELRTALNEAYAAASRTPPTYTHSTIVAQTTGITAADIAELRAAVVAIR
jgi:hypothetical protein